MSEQPQPFHLLAVGKPYAPWRTAWSEGADYNFRGGEHEFRIFLEGATRREIAAIDSGPVEFGLLAEPSGLGLFLITRFGETTFGCFYSWHRVSPEERTLPRMSHGFL